MSGSGGRRWPLAALQSTDLTAQGNNDKYGVFGDNTH